MPHSPILVWFSLIEGRTETSVSVGQAWLPQAIGNTAVMGFDRVFGIPQDYKSS